MLCITLQFEWDSAIYDIFYSLDYKISDAKSFLFCAKRQKIYKKTFQNKKKKQQKTFKTKNKRKEKMMHVETENKLNNILCNRSIFEMEI